MFFYRILPLFLFFCSLVRVQEEVTVHLKDLLTGNNNYYTLSLPRGYNLLVQTEPDMSFGETVTYQYCYKKGIVLYVGNNAIGVNELLIEQYIGEDTGYNYLVGNNLLLDKELSERLKIPSNWDLSGKTRCNKYWRDVENFSWVIGYRNVPKRHLALFNTIIDSFIKNYQPQDSQDCRE